MDGEWIIYEIVDYISLLVRLERIRSKYHRWIVVFYSIVHENIMELHPAQEFHCPSVNFPGLCSCGKTKLVFSFLFERRWCSLLYIFFLLLLPSSKFLPPWPSVQCSSIINWRIHIERTVVMHLWSKPNHIESNHIVTVPMDFWERGTSIIWTVGYTFSIWLYILHN